MTVVVATCSSTSVDRSTGGRFNRTFVVLLASAITALVASSTAWMVTCRGHAPSPLRIQRHHRFSSQQFLPPHRLRHRLRSSAEEQSDLELHWIPLDVHAPDVEPSGAPGTTVLPVFPIGGDEGAYVPHENYELTIFEPRYRKLYNDILMSGSRRFVVPSFIHPDGERMSSVGVVFYLTELEDVSEETRDQVKYVCDHEVIGRVRITQILNPGAWEDDSQYLLAETTPIEDGDDSQDNTTQLEATVLSQLSRVMHLKEYLDNMPLASDVQKQLNATRNVDNGLWDLVSLWAEYYDSLLEERESLLDDDRQESFAKWMDKDGYEREEEGYVPGRLPGKYSFADFEEDDDEDEDDDEFYDDDDDDDDDYMDDIKMEELPPEMQVEMLRLEGHYRDDADILLDQKAELLHRLIQSTSHRQRLELLRSAFAAEERRLSAKMAIKDAISPPDSPPEVTILDLSSRLGGIGDLGFGSGKPGLT